MELKKLSHNLREIAADPSRPEAILGLIAMGYRFFYKKGCDAGGR